MFRDIRGLVLSPGDRKYETDVSTLALTVTRGDHAREYGDDRSSREPGACIVSAALGAVNRALDDLARK